MSDERSEDLVNRTDGVTERAIGSEEQALKGGVGIAVGEVEEEDDETPPLGTVSLMCLRLLNALEGFVRKLTRAEGVQLSESDTIDGEGVAGEGHSTGSV